MATFLLYLYLALAQVLSVEATYKVTKGVFAHYMVGTTTTAHIQQDVDDAVAMGLDGFALNIADPTQTYAINTFTTMIAYVAQKYPNSFGVFISMDISASGDASPFTTLINSYSLQQGWLQGPDGNPFLSTYTDGGYSTDRLLSFKNSLSNSVYFVPDLDPTTGYYDNADGWWSYWNADTTLFQGLFSWESMWPALAGGEGGASAGDVSPDATVMAGTVAHSKSYMMGLSTMQYKDSYFTNVYRGGELNLPTRMKNILSMSTAPNFIEIVSWNDGPESHYIGNLWPEQNTDAQPAIYSNQKVWSHSGWQPLIKSFITAFKNKWPATKMTTPTGQTAIGALWYKTIFQNTTCANDDGGDLQGTSNIEMYNEKPEGWSTGLDQLNWAVVVNTTGYSLRLNSGSKSQTVSLVAGLNSGSSTIFNSGVQSMQVLNSKGKVVAGTAPGRCVFPTCQDGIYNMNVQVLPLSASITTNSASCTSGSSTGSS